MKCEGRWKIALALAGIFLAGGSAGFFAGMAWSRQDARPRVSPDQFTERYLQRMISDVKLTSEQVECLRPMMEEFSEKISIMKRKGFVELMNVVGEMDKRIEADLTDEQRQLYHEMQERERKNWERRFTGGHGRRDIETAGPPPPPTPPDGD